ncbi:hypothetical protein [Actinoallomurus sp. NPDC050550]|uniref:hypothetical protein n=1 Tax=Actinoallomurus sp. NPDC050550 TaxID=3154937 RepID=UPI00340195A9
MAGLTIATALIITGCYARNSSPPPKQDNLVKTVRTLLTAYDNRDERAVLKMLGPQWRSKISEQLARFGGRRLRDAHITVTEDLQDSYVVDIDAPDPLRLRTDAFWQRDKKQWGFNPLTDLTRLPSPGVS